MDQINATDGAGTYGIILPIRRKLLLMFAATCWKISLHRLSYNSSLQIMFVGWTQQATLAHLWRMEGIHINILQKQMLKTISIYTGGLSVFFQSLDMEAQFHSANTGTLRLPYINFMTICVESHLSVLFTILRHS